VPPFTPTSHVTKLINAKLEERIGQRVRISDPFSWPAPDDKATYPLDDKGHEKLTDSFVRTIPMFDVASLWQAQKGVHHFHTHVDSDVTLKWGHPARSELRKNDFWIESL
jgi:hypothetical protein